jgi:hypothetical protein
MCVGGYKRRCGKHSVARQQNRAESKSGVGLAVDSRAWRRTAVIVLVALPTFRAPSGPVVQVAMLDTVGAVRGSETNETEILKQQWKNSTVQSFDKQASLENWETNWPAGNKMTAKVIYDRAAGEVRVLLHQGDKSQQKTFAIEQDLATTLQQVNDFIHAQWNGKTLKNEQ